MTMTTKLNGLLGFIKENSKNGEVWLYPPELSELGLSELDANRIIDDLLKTKVILSKRIAFAPNKIQPTFPKQADFSSVANDTYCIPVFLLRIDEEGVRQILNENLKSNFNDKKPAILIGKKTISLPPYKNEHYFCRVAFKHPVNELVDWSEIYEKMTGNDVFKGGDKSKTEWRVVYDAMEAVNGKVKKQTDNTLFEWKEKTIRRLY